MNFLLPIRNAVTGEEKNFSDKQQIANFLASCTDPQQWEGWAHLGELPTPTAPEALGPTATQSTDGY